MCWVCHRSTTACATCRHFRRSVAAQLGYCGLDRKRRPLRGDEIRACWESAGAGVTGISTSTPRTVGPIALGGEAAPVRHYETGTFVRKLEFVEVRTTPTAAKAATEGDGSGAEPQDVGRSIIGDPLAIEPRWSLWGDPEL